MSERFVSGLSAKIVLYKYSSFPFLSFLPLSAPLMMSMSTAGMFDVDCQANGQ